MDLFMLVWKKIMRLRKKINMLKVLDASKQKSVLELFPEANSDLERSYFQYKCQCCHMGKAESYFLMVSSFFLFIIYWMMLCSKGRRVKLEQNSYDAVYVESTGLGANIIPQSLHNEFFNIFQLKFGEKKILDQKAKMFLLKSFKKHPFSLYFNFKNMISVAIYSAIIVQFAPKAIISCSEWSFGSSLCTAYCNSCGVELINILHGEKLYHIRDSFFRYNRFYVWDEHYVNLFKSLRADPEQFIVEVPPSICLNLPPFDENSPEAVELKFYLEIEDREKLKRLKDVIDSLLANGIKLKIRPHPRATDIKMFADFFQGEIVEDPMQITFEQSLATTKNAVARYSTVLNQAFHSGRGVVIDDLSDPITYEKLFEVNYVMLEKKHRLLSEFIN